jgi:hypothetical protein
MNFKYIVLDDSFVIVSREYLSHQQLTNNPETVTSAGFVFVDFAKRQVTCHGESIGLKVKMDKEDDFRLNKFFFK